MRLWVHPISAAPVSLQLRSYLNALDPTQAFVFRWLFSFAAGLRGARVFFWLSAFAGDFSVVGLATDLPSDFAASDC